MINRILYTCLLLLFGSGSALADTRYHFVRITGLSEQVVGEQLLKDIYHRLKTDITVEAMPGKRALFEASQGIKDGETLRIWSVGEKYPTLIRVPTPISSLITTGFARKDRDIVLKNKSDLANYRIVIVRGVQHVKNITLGLKKVHVISDPDQLMRIVHLGRSDLALTGYLNGISLLKKAGIKDVAPVKNPLGRLNLYHYIHEKHKAIVPRVDAVIKQMVESGEMKTLREKYEQEYLNNL